MAVGRSARERARADITQEIKDEARAQLRVDGPHGLSLRSVARALGFAPSALYRYFPSRDDLLTALIIDAYDAMGEAAERADDPTEPPFQRWRRVGHAVHAWARENRAEYILIYGSPVPGYQAPQDTVAPASRVPKVLVGIAEQARDSALPPLLGDQMTRTAAVLGSGIAPGALARVIAAWTQLLGMISFELFGQFTGTVEPADELLDTVLRRQALDIGLPA
ncbi:TetR/AcrR family transcriptional regulator [Actinokineospora soli]